MNLSKKDKKYFQSKGFDVQSVEAGIAFALGYRPESKQIPALFKDFQLSVKEQAMQMVNKKLLRQMNHVNKPGPESLTTADMQAIISTICAQISAAEQARDSFRVAAQGSLGKENKNLYYKEASWYNSKAKQLAKLQTKLKRIKIK